MPVSNKDAQHLLQVQNLEKRYVRASTVSQREEVTALRGVSLSILPQVTLALVGESGSGKSTLARCVACLDKPTSGTIRFGSDELTKLNEKDLRAIRPKIQLVFQDPANSLNPRWTAFDIVSEPFVIQQRFSNQERRERTFALLESVGLSSQKASQRPAEFSGGQRQRLAIARALALEPQLLILDEALSALDCSIQAQIVNLLFELQSSLGLSYLFITHDFAMAAHVSDEIVVMDHGQIVETGPTERIARSPKHPVTQRLMTAATASQVLPRELQAV
ncbi:MAG: ABC transporter ATP-binding protein [Candidatus Acidiferrum sp.]|jgi:ABC-type glutathione transport system ATPase component